MSVFNHVDPPDKNKLLALVLILLGLFLSSPTQTSGKEPSAAPTSQTKYLLFQIFTYSGDNIGASAVFPPKAEVAATVRDIIARIGTTGNARQKLGFCVGPLTVSHSDDEIRRQIGQAFEIAKTNDVAVAFHIDDQMFWDRNSELLKDQAANIEWLGWGGPPCTGRRLEWGPQPSKVAPQLCLNSPVVQSVVSKRAYLIGSEIRNEVNKLESQGKGYLFAGAIAGWETQIGRDFATNSSLGYHALSNLGYNNKTAAAQCDSERCKIVKQFIETWAKNLERAGLSPDKVYCHIAFTEQGLASGSGNDAGKEISYSQQVDFATPDIAFGKIYRPGFSTYPMADTLNVVRDEVAKRGNPPWISAEGTNVVPNGMPGEGTMETYLGKMFNHGAVMVNVFSWGMGGEAQKNNMFRRATENAEALSAYRKFLSGAKLQEVTSAATEFSPVKLQKKIQTIQARLPEWVQRTRRADLVQPMMIKLDQSIKNNKVLEADKTADQILNLISGDKK